MPTAIKISADYAIKRAGEVIHWVGSHAFRRSVYSVLVLASDQRLHFGRSAG